MTTEPVIPVDTRKIPTVVLVAAILNFIGCFFAALFALLAFVVVIFGNTLGWYTKITEVMNNQYPSVNLGVGISFVLLVIGILCAVSFILTLFLAIGLLKGKRWAWFGQVASSIVGLLGFPVATIINIILLIFLFQPPTRNFFKV